MVMPTKYDVTLPLLMTLKNSASTIIRNVIPSLAKECKLSPEEQQERLDCGEPRFANRVRWAAWELEKAGLLEKTGKGEFKITKEGSDVLKSPPGKIDQLYLMRFTKYQEAVKEWVSGPSQSEIDKEISEVPEEDLIQTAHRKYNEKLASEILDTIMGCSSRFFEHLVVDLIVAMGYGGSRTDADRALLGGPKDGGVDGVIKEDKLGLSSIYIQAKKWKENVGSSRIRDFIGALKLKGANKGIFITPSGFTQDAIEAASKLIEIKVALIDGKELANLMIKYNVGVSKAAEYVINKIDQDYFDDE